MNDSSYMFSHMCNLLYEIFVIFIDLVCPLVAAGLASGAHWNTCQF